MEDAHIASTNIVQGCHLFGVFDGHGGKKSDLYQILG